MSDTISWITCVSCLSAGTCLPWLQSHAIAESRRLEARYQGIPTNDDLGRRFRTTPEGEAECRAFGQHVLSAWDPLCRQAREELDKAKAAGTTVPSASLGTLLQLYHHESLETFLSRLYVSGIKSPRSGASSARSSRGKPATTPATSTPSCRTKRRRLSNAHQCSGMRWWCLSVC